MGPRYPAGTAVLATAGETLLAHGNGAAAAPRIGSTDDAPACRPPVEEPTVYIEGSKNTNTSWFGIITRYRSRPRYARLAYTALAYDSSVRFLPHSQANN